MKPASRILNNCCCHDRSIAHDECSRLGVSLPPQMHLQHMERDIYKKITYSSAKIKENMMNNLPVINKKTADICLHQLPQLWEEGKGMTSAGQFAFRKTTQLWDQGTGRPKSVITRPEAAR